MNITLTPAVPDSSSLCPSPGPGAMLSAHLPEDGACRLHGRIQHPHHFVRAADQQLRLWTRQHPAA